MSISGIGSVDLRTPQNQSLSLSNVYFVPTLSANLLSVGQLVDSAYSIYFTSSGCVIPDRCNGKVIGTGSKRGQTFLLDVGLGSLFASSALTDKLWTIWHQRLGHLNNAKLISLFKRGCLDSINNTGLGSLSKYKCAYCC